MLATKAIVEHEAVVHPTVDGKHGQRGELPDQLTLFAAGNPKRGDRRLQPRHGDIFEEDRTDQMKCEEFTLLLFKIQDPQKVGAAGDYHGELFVCQRRKKKGASSFKLSNAGICCENGQLVSLSCKDGSKTVWYSAWPQPISS